MNPEIKTKWTEALRSGEFKQGTRALKRDDRFCCLGVLCELYRREHADKVSWTTRSRDGRHHEYLDAHVGTSFLPRPVMDWAELQHPDPLLGEDTAVHHNDSAGLTFESIADLIDEHL